MCSVVSLVLSICILDSFSVFLLSPIFFCIRLFGCYNYCLLMFFSCALKLFFKRLHFDVILRCEMSFFVWSWFGLCAGSLNRIVHDESFLKHRKKPQLKWEMKQMVSGPLPRWRISQFILTVCSTLGFKATHHFSPPWYSLHRPYSFRSISLSLSVSISLPHPALIWMMAIIVSSHQPSDFTCSSSIYCSLCRLFALSTIITPAFN